MGSSSSVLPKSPKKSCDDEEEPSQKFDEDASTNLLTLDVDNSLMDLPKKVLVLRIQEMQSRSNTDANNSNKNISNVGLIPRSIFSELENGGAETLRTKDIFISQLQSELRAQKLSFENQKLQAKQKLGAYATEITDLRIKTNKRIYELEIELKKQNNSTCLLDHQNPLIMKLSQKINEQDQIIKELESSLSRKDEIIEGFKIFESCQYNKRFDTSEESQQSSKDLDFGFEKISRNTRSFISQDLVMVDSFNRPVELSLSEENCYCTEQLYPSKYVPSKNDISTRIDGTSLNCKILSKNSAVTPSAKHLVKLPTDIIGSSASKIE